MLESLGEEPASGDQIPFLSDQHVNDLAKLVDRTVQIDPLPGDLDTLRCGGRGSSDVSEEVLDLRVGCFGPVPPRLTDATLKQWPPRRTVSLAQVEFTNGGLDSPAVGLRSLAGLVMSFGTGDQGGAVRALQSHSLDCFGKAGGTTTLDADFGRDVVVSAQEAVLSGDGLVDIRGQGCATNATDRPPESGAPCGRSRHRPGAVPADHPSPRVLAQPRGEDAGLAISSRSIGRPVSMSTSTVPKTRPRRRAKSSTPRPVTAPICESGSARTTRNNVLWLAGYPAW